LRSGSEASSESTLVLRSPLASRGFCLFCLQLYAAASACCSRLDRLSRAFLLDRGNAARRLDLCPGCRRFWFVRPCLLGSLVTNAHGTFPLRQHVPCLQ